MQHPKLIGINSFYGEDDRYYDILDLSDFSIKQISDEKTAEMLNEGIEIEAVELYEEDCFKCRLIYDEDDYSSQKPQLYRIGSYHILIVPYLIDDGSFRLRSTMRVYYQNDIYTEIEIYGVPSIIYYYFTSNIDVILGTNAFNYSHLVLTIDDSKRAINIQIYKKYEHLEKDIFDTQHNDKGRIILIHKQTGRKYRWQRSGDALINGSRKKVICSYEDFRKKETYLKVTVPKYYQVMNNIIDEIHIYIDSLLPDIHQNLIYPLRLEALDDDTKKQYMKDLIICILNIKFAKELAKLALSMNMIDFRVEYIHDGSDKVQFKPLVYTNEDNEYYYSECSWSPQYKFPI